MKVKKYSAEFIHKEDGTVIVDERTLVSTFTKKKKKKVKIRVSGVVCC